MDLRQNIKAIAKKRGMKMADVADKLGITYPSLAQSLNRDMQISTIKRIADVLQVPLWMLLQDTPDVLQPQKNQPNIVGFLKIGDNAVEEVHSLSEILALVRKYRQYLDYNSHSLMDSITDE